MWILNVELDIEQFYAPSLVLMPNCSKVYAVNVFSFGGW
jgi:hypothetical protein